MTDAEEISARIEALRTQLQQVYRVKGHDLAHALRRAKRLLPRRIRKAGAMLSDAQPKFGNPKLERTVDFAALRSAHDEITEHLEQVDVKAIRQRRLIGMAALISFYVIFIAACFLIWMVRAGQL